MAYKYTPTDREKEEYNKDLRKHYQTCFDGLSGEKVIEHLTKIIEDNQGLDRDAPNGNACIWYSAQRALLKTITNKVTKTT